MKITLFWNLDSQKYSGNEIKNALLKLGHEVDAINDKEFEIGELVEKANKSDLFLFHHGGVSTQTEFEFQLSLTRLQQILEAIKCKKVMWFLDKVQGSGEIMADQIIPFVDKAYFNDDTWVRRSKYDNVFSLRAGCELKNGIGTKQEKIKAKIAFVGSVYGTREIVFENLRQEYGREFMVFQNCWGDDLVDLCASVKVILAPAFPTDDFYWSDRIYRTLAAGGFLLHPESYGLIEEGFENGKHLAFYKNWNEMKAAIDWFTNDEHEKERQKIIKAGKEKVKEFIWENRLKTIINEAKT